jgi:RNA polymerase-binding transcription factor DksA
MAAKSPTKKSAGSKPAPAKPSAAKPAAPAKKATAKAPATPAKTTAPAKKAPPAKPTKASTNGKQQPAKAAPAKKAAAKQPAQPPAKSAAPAPVKAKPAATDKKAPATTPAKAPAKAPAAAAPSTTPPPTPKSTKPATDTMTNDTQLPKPKFSKEGLGYTKDFDLAFIKAQYDMLQQERIHLTGQAKRLEDEAHQLVEEAEMGDVQFDDEGGEGDTMVVERERDLALSAQARDAVAEIDAALVRIAEGTYGYSVMSGRPIPKERLEAIPWSSVLVEEKVGGIGRR